MVLKPVVMNYGTTEIHFEKEVRVFCEILHNKTIHNISFKTIQSPDEKMYKSKKSVTLQNNNYMT